MTMNKVQKKVIGAVVPIIIILIGFVVIGDGGSTSTPFRGEGGITFNPFSYFEVNGGEWSFVVLLIGAFEFVWWKDPKKKSE